MNNKVEKWKKWLDTIGIQIQNMLIKQDTHYTVLKIIADNKKLHQHNLFYDHLFHTYIAYISVSLRRQLKYSKNSISMLGLLTDISENISLICVSKTVSIDPKQDIKNLKNRTLLIENYVDKRIAHTDKGNLNKLLNPNEIEEAIQLLKAIHKKYNAAINQESIELMPTLYDWTHIFNFPWVAKK